MKNKDYKIVEIEWEDAQSSLQQLDLGLELQDFIKQDLLKTKSCGYLIHEDEQKIILGFMLFDSEKSEEEGLLKHYQIIPKKMIKNIIELKKCNSEVK